MDAVFKRIHCHVTRSSSIFDTQIEPFRNQIYDNIKSDCLKRKQLFEDPLFPATRTSLFYSNRIQINLNDVVWRRPFEIVKDPLKPKFIENVVNAEDLHQGSIGDCWFIASCAAIAQQPELFSKVVPTDQSFDDGDYSGIFHFRFWIYGVWHDVVIDDRLPVWKNANQLVFCKNKKEPNEFWAALIEKAYAKVFGSYESIDGGLTSDGLIDLTGGIEETFNIRNLQTEVKRNEIWEVIKKSRRLRSLTAAFLEPDPCQRDAPLYNGLVKGHAYTITKHAVIKYKNKNVKLIRMRNPWGNDVEWKGPWSDNSKEWDCISDAEKDLIGFKVAKDGEFWMDYNDFYQNFHTLQLCSLTPDAFSGELLDNTNKSLNTTWKMVAYHGEWKLGVSAGGCGQGNQALYWTNPQFLVTLIDVDPDDNEDKCTLIVSLMQKNTRENRMLRRQDNTEEYIQFSLYRIKDQKDADRAKLTGEKLYASQLERCGTSEAYINRREVTRRFREPAGSYLIIPSCYEAYHEAKFLLRVFTEQTIDEKNASVLNENKKNLTQSDIFFQTTEVEKGFDEWLHLLGNNNKSQGKSCAQEIQKPNQPRQYIKRRAIVCVRSMPNGRMTSECHEEIEYLRGSLRSTQNQIVKTKDACQIM